MAGVNKVILIGNLGRDPEIRYTQGGQPVANFTLATSESFSTKDGKSRSGPSGTASSRGAARQRLLAVPLQGPQVYIEGRLQTREWEDKEGQKRRTTEVVATPSSSSAREGAGAGGRESYDGGGNEPPPAPVEATTSPSRGLAFERLSARRAAARRAR